jgi:hypothetical protein
MTKKIGRPSGYNEDIALRICERLACGEPMKRICADPDMPAYTSVLKWQREHAEFSDLTARAKLEGTHALADECLEIADNPEIDTQDKRVRIDTRIRLIGKWHSRAYGDRLDLNAKVEHSDVSDEALVEKLAAILGKGSPNT